MQKIVEVSVNWLTPEKCFTVGDMPDFFKKNGGKSGIYFWIHHGKKQPRIAYIGEARRFADRFAEHLELSLHGQYSAVDCCNGDLLDFYNCHAQYYGCHNDTFSCAKGYAACPYYRPGLYKKYPPLPGTLDKRSKDIGRGVSINRRFLEALTCIFAEVSSHGKAEACAKLRKELEGLFMLQLLKSMVGKKQVADGAGGATRLFCSPRNSFFWGCVNRYPQAETEYRIRANHAPSHVLQEELGWQWTSEKPVWTFSVADVLQLQRFHDEHSESGKIVTSRT